MNITRKHLIPLILLMLCFSCSGDEEPLPAKNKPLFEIMVVFAPGQLGDRGYADNVMEGINLLSFQSNGEENEDDGVDVRFVSPWSFSTIDHTIEKWVENTESPFSDDSYRRRLLVLTEPYMVNMLRSSSNKLRPTDEVLLLKVNDEDVETAAQELGLGNRLHGLNISAAYNMRRYCHHMKRISRLMEQIDNKTIDLSALYYYRLYDSDFSVYRDSVYETLVEELGTSTEIITRSLSDELYEGIYSPVFEKPVIDAAYIYASLHQSVYELSRRGFAIINLGSGNAGWDYWLMSRTSKEDTFYTLVIDGDEAPLNYRIFIKRYFGFALANWCFTWVDSAIGEMPTMITLSGEDYCHDNIPDDK